MDIGLAVGLIGIGIGIYFGLRGFRKGIGEQLSVIKDQTKPIKDIKDMTSDMAKEIRDVSKIIHDGWDIFKAQLSKGGTVERNLPNLGKVSISAKPGQEVTTYHLEVQRPVLNGDFVEKKSREIGLYHTENIMFGREAKHIVLSPRTMLIYVPSTNPTTCREYIAIYLKWLDSKYFESLKEIKDYEDIDLT